MERNDILKVNWERRQPSLLLSNEEIERALAAYSEDNIVSSELMGTGCANLNYKIVLSSAQIVILRVYTRDRDALMREYHLHKLVHTKMPVPRFLYINEEVNVLSYPFAILEYVEGRVFRDVILKGNEIAVKECSYQAGTYLAQMASIDLKESGFFNFDLSIKPFVEGQTFDKILLSFLREPKVITMLGNELVQTLVAHIGNYKEILVDLSHQHNLTHADYDPSNMLVTYENGRWKIAAILDWEFSFSSSYYVDMGLMLRYASHLPAIYQDTFIAGIRDGNFALLQDDWRLRTKLADMLSLLSICASEGSEQRLNMVRDIKTILCNTCKYWISSK